MSLFIPNFLYRALLKQNPGGDNTIWMRCIMFSAKYGAPHPLPVAMVILADPQPVSVLYLHWMNSLLPTSSKVRCKIGILKESGISYQTQVSLICPSHKMYTLGTHILHEYLAFVHCICQTLQLIQFGSSNWDINSHCLLFYGLWNTLTNVILYVRYIFIYFYPSSNRWETPESKTGIKI